MGFWRPCILKHDASLPAHFLIPCETYCAFHLRIFRASFLEAAVATRNLNTVEPLLTSHPLSGHSLLSGQSSESSNNC